MYALERTHLLRHDRSWVPTSVRAVGWTVSGTIWAGSAAALVGGMIASPAVLVLWKALALGGAGVVVAGERAGSYAFRRQLAKLTRGEVALERLKVCKEGELACVRGTIEATHTLTGLLHDSPGVYRRMVFGARGFWVHEAAVDFSLVDHAGNRIFVQAAGARWLEAFRERIDYPKDQLLRAEVPAAVRERVARATSREAIHASERVLRVGDAVQIVGYKTATPDVAGDVGGDYRSPPTRATLRSGDELPLVITSLVGAAR
ncbi:MAG: hypothetical protein AB7P03_19065 [Kofleriaceae bacterium]